VRERGVQLSRGQKQSIAIAIARALLKDPTGLLLDAESECVLQEALERIIKRRTAVLMAHRLSTIRGVDNIAVVQNGRIVERGSHGGSRGAGRRRLLAAAAAAAELSFYLAPAPARPVYSLPPQICRLLIYLGE
jgi:ABC-type bacteriocin/lantibiotic exporter with double-glycine peptidase domain